MNDGYLENLPEIDLGPEKPERKKKRQSGDKIPVVRYMPTRCPSCGSEKTRIYSSRDRPVRYHKCNDCGQNFKSIEANPG